VCEVLDSLPGFKLDGHQLSVVCVYLQLPSVPGALSLMRNTRLSTALMTGNPINLDHLVLLLNWD